MYLIMVTLLVIVWETEKYQIRNIGKISFNYDHPFIKDFIELKKLVGDRGIAKQTIPSPNQLFEHTYT